MDSYSNEYLAETSPTAQTPLSGFAAVEGVHHLKEMPLMGKINLRGDKHNPDFTAGLMQALQVTLPAKANRVAPFLGGLIFWLGPDEWLIHCKLRDTSQQIASLRAALAACHCAVTDVTDYSTVIEISGPQSREVLASACPLDTRVNHFKPGHCAQTRFGHASVLLWPVNEAPCYALQVAEL